MYSIAQQAELISKAKNMIETNVGIDRISALKEVLNFADWTYYVNDNPILADQEYDLLFKKLKDLESEFPNSITQDSPTQRIAKGLNKDFPSVSHLVPMLSLENSYNANDLIDWDRKCRELCNEEIIEYCIEPKFDGASISLVYENEYLSRAATRGDGVQGDEMTNNAKQIRSIPLYANLKKFHIQQIEIRGEVLINKKTFIVSNEKLVADGNPPLANPRNAASGSLRMKDPKEVAKRGLDCFLYHVSNLTLDKEMAYPNEFRTHYDTLKSLESIGFKTSFANTKLVNSIQDVIATCNEFELKRDELPYEIDGMVIKVNRLELQDKIGQTSHHPRWAIAFKFKARQATSKLLNVEYQVGRTGSITPVAKIEPVYVGGVTISSLSLFNEEVVKEKNLMIGDTVLIERAGDVIPYVVKSFPELRNGSEQPIQFLTHCPVCNEVLYKPLEEAVWRCTNINCEAQVIERIAHFASKDAMDIRGLGDALVRKFFEQGYLHTLTGIYQLPYEKIKGLEGFGERSMLNLKDSIEKSKTQTLNRILFGLGIRYVGETTAKTLARNIQHISDLYKMTVEDLCQLEDIGIKVAGSIVDFFSHPDNRKLIDELEACGLNFKNDLKQEYNDGGLVGKTFLFTGTMTMKRSDAEALVESKGGNILGSVSSKLNYLVVGEDAGSKLEKAKKLGTIHIMNEEDFLNLIHNDGHN
ncbi:MAG TPA: NAD-dependent DNA ligase LigA [Chitinophagaceae bacterium]|nr:NAD-dependent DNA ligase LigA [Chitinophagaceae bacterium]